MKKVTRYQASNGELFTKKDEAKKYQKLLKVKCEIF